MELLRHLGQLGYVLALNTKANTSSTQQDVHEFIKSAWVVDWQVRTIKSRNVVSLQGWPCGHKAPHGGHYF
jgi:hypothetical protein